LGSGTAHQKTDDQSTGVVAMNSLTKTWVLSGKATLRTLAESLSFLLNQLKPGSLSTDFLAWRDRFLRDRLFLLLWISFPSLLVFSALDIHALFIHAKEFEDKLVKLFGDASLADSLRFLTIGTDLAMGIGILACLLIFKHPWGQRHAALFFLTFSSTVTLLPQFLGTVMQIPVPNITLWIMVFLAQATLIPVHWRLHVLSQFNTLFYYIVINSLFGLTKIGEISIYNVGDLVTLLWCCLICDLAVYLYERLKQSDFESQRQLNVFLHSVSHDLRAPVIGTSIVLQNLLKKSTDTVVLDRTVVERLLQGCDRQLFLINSLLEAHACEVQGIVLHCQPLQLSHLLQDIVADMEPVVSQNQVTLINQVNPDLPLVSGDATQLWRVFNNLISNALKHNPRGITITLTAEIVADPISAKTDQAIDFSKRHSASALKPSIPQPNNNAWLRCSIQDNGVGIDPKQCQRLFELYTRGSRARYMPGLGLGLYLCKKIIQAHGGQMGVLSAPHQGSTFWFTLPLVGNDRSPHHRSPHHHPPTQ
jgi:signal transduction histidine kinase